MGTDFIEEDIKKCQYYTDRIMEVLNPLSAEDLPVIATSLRTVHRAVVGEMRPEQKLLYALMREVIASTSVTVKEERL